MNPPAGLDVSFYSSESFAAPIWVSCISFPLFTFAFVLASIWFNRARDPRALFLVLGCLLYATARIPEFLSAIPFTNHSFSAFQIARFTSRFAPWSDLVATLLFTGYILSRSYQSFNPRINDE